MSTTLTRCAPCERDGDIRMAVEVHDDTPLCGACLVETRRFRLIADLELDAPAKVPAMKRGRVPNPEPA